VVNVVTRSVSNQFHGSLYDFFRNSVMDANNWFSNKFGDPIPPLKRNDFGGTIGGPIKKDKTFFFFDYEGLRQRDFASTTSGVPTECMRGAGGSVHRSASGYSARSALKGALLTLQGAAQFAGHWDPYTGVFNSDS
jgi:hypothetical protein